MISCILCADLILVATPFLACAASLATLRARRQRKAKSEAEAKPPAK